jgi:hypothetical protein
MAPSALLRHDPAGTEGIDGVRANVKALACGGCQAGAATRPQTRLNAPSPSVKAQARNLRRYKD